MGLLLLALAVPLGANAQTERPEMTVMAPESGQEQPHSEEFEAWLRAMPTTVAPNPNGIMEPVEPDFLKDIALKPGQGMPVIDHQRLHMPVLSKEDAEMIYWGKQLEQQRREPGAMTIGVPILPALSYLLHKILPDWKLKTPRERRRERLQRILDAYDDSTTVHP